MTCAAPVFGQQADPGFTLPADVGGLLSDRVTLTVVLFGLLGIAPGLLIMLTCFPLVVTVLSILRQGIGLPQSPPNMLIISLALFLTWFVMDPVFTEAWTRAGAPLLSGDISPAEALARGIEPFRGFMEHRVPPDEIAALAALRPVPPGAAPIAPGADPPLSVLIPAFMLSEVQRAFQIGFLMLLPFLIIDLVVSAILMSMGMMMVPPAVVSLPFKLAFFVVADGWTLVAGALVRSYG
ncbi:flagellar type III secretion system pore protein FliP [Frigidibacter sp. MR17.24]|uniref:flagellar type III secretion system pore protein FliP n=1 Tax=Frigidibacter sp. MR17.24 TaxID=3127345 RepID=UPI003FA6094E